MTTEEGARIIAQEREIEDLKLQVEELKQERDKYKEKEKTMNNLCGICYKTRSKIREDCIHYHCEHQMGASIDCCLKTGQLGDCPCTDDCKDFISKNDRIVVVRCKDCKKANTEECPISYWDDDWGKWRISYAGDNWFCADGEKRE